MTTTTVPLNAARDCPGEADPRSEVVVGFDGSLASIAALNSADILAEKLGWSVHVVSVVQPMSVYAASIGGESPSEIDALRVQLRDVAVRHIERDPRRAAWTRDVAVGDPATEVLRIAREHNAHLIILGRADHESIGMQLGGSIAADVIAASSIPVLLVEAELERISTAVVAVDFRLASLGAAAMAMSLLGEKGTLYLVYVDEISTALRPTQKHSENYPGETLVLFRRLLEQLKPPPGILVQTTILVGKPAAAIIEFAECMHADFVALGRRSLSPAARAVLGSVTDNVVRIARFPLVIAPADTVTYGGVFA